MQGWHRRILKQRDSVLLWSALLCLLLAVYQPTVPVQKQIHTYFLIADISQSMNAMDMRLGQQTVSRLDYTKRLLHDLVAEMPCHTNVSIGVFAGDAVAALYAPLEVCQHFSAIQETIDHLDWRMAWSGNSRLRESLLVSSAVVRTMPDATKVVYFTDGDEAPLLHAFNTNNLKEFQGGQGWFFIGIGSDQGVGIPKLTEDNQKIGYWSNESFAVQPNIAQVTASKSSGRDDSVAVSEYDRYISRRASKYLQTLASEIGGSYLPGDQPQAVLEALQSFPSSHINTVPFRLDWLFAGLALTCLLASSLHREALHRMRHWYQRLVKPAQPWFKAADRVAHDNHF